RTPAASAAAHTAVGTARLIDFDFPMGLMAAEASRRAAARPDGLKASPAGRAAGTAGAPTVSR
ncbi:hypothetical protein ABZ383_20390, partial [Streptomyces sp. NPDC005900]|uniref:hypothetical protein n=1 Tax=Streptomyces sp. NPDC005900 TaxID=3154569 RepID=UPI0033F31F07